MRLLPSIKIGIAMSDAASLEESIFNVARQLSHPQDRAAYLSHACADSQLLRERIERLLAAESQADQFLANNPLEIQESYNRLQKTPNEADNSACSGADRSTECPPMTTVAPVPGDVFEDYEIIEKIGGNMGLVFKARHRLLD